MNQEEMALRENRILDAIGKPWEEKARHPPVTLYLDIDDILLLEKMIMRRQGKCLINRNVFSAPTPGNRELRMEAAREASLIFDLRKLAALHQSKAGLALIVLELCAYGHLGGRHQAGTRT